ncbi:hypothetical protein AVDCRST_MAG92-1636 [uncultured Coleofasciculus sp.]|uniref:Uncharacterized protein n=1 Tax=uncultured Coleofasciculus sp. TaxID=1267456 RepID=A0A6J4I862_9CYAN|nr:hypothetical protein AVDCRST_MAG92-1636 [uncultured Coleofasciculus sp.]
MFSARPVKNLIMSADGVVSCQLFSEMASLNVLMIRMLFCLIRK